MEPDIAFVASLIGETARARMLMALMGGKALTATELALEAEVTSQTASSHLTKMVSAQLLQVRKQGRHKYFQLKGLEVAELLEKLLNISSGMEYSKIFTGPHDADLKKARICYDHLAGEVGVAIYDALANNEYILDKGEETVLTNCGRSFFNKLGFDYNNTKKSNRPLCKSCLDWSERRNHLAGSLGQWILNDIFNKGWAAKDIDSRAVRFTKEGICLFSRAYSIDVKIFN